MLQVEEALEQILARVTPLGVEHVELMASLGRGLAEPIVSEYLQGKITRAEAAEQLQGLSGYGEPGAHALLTAAGGGRR